MMQLRIYIYSVGLLERISYIAITTHPSFGVAEEAPNIIMQCATGNVEVSGPNFGIVVGRIFLWPLQDISNRPPT